MNFINLDIMELINFLWTVVAMALGGAFYMMLDRWASHLSPPPPKVNWRKNWARVQGHAPKYKESDRLGGAPPKDNWVRDGSEPPPKPDSFSTIDVIVVHGKHKG